MEDSTLYNVSPTETFKLWKDTCWISCVLKVQSEQSAIQIWYSFHKNLFFSPLKWQPDSKLTSLTAGGLICLANFLPFMKPKVSSPRTQQPIAGQYPKPDQSNPQLSNLFPYNLFNIILPSMPKSSKWYFSFRLSNKNVVWIFITARELHTSPI
jgi:hypothetical protein